MKPIAWVGSAYKDFRSFPDDVQDSMGYALYRAQIGARHDSAKPLRGFGGASALELVEAHEGDAFRAVYTVRFADMLYVLHAFQKKSRAGIKTSQADIDLVKQRLKQAEADYHRRQDHHDES